MNNLNLKNILKFAHSPLHNYVIPGLSSYLLGQPSSEEMGCVRLFKNSRTQVDHIVPHSHRFDFECLVLKGYVNNVIYTEGSGGDEYCMSSLAYRGKPGHYDKVVVKTAMSFLTHTKVYGEGDWYSMTKDQIHSINFSKDAVVLFFEGETQTSMTFVLEPWVNGQCIPMMKTQDWMFQK